MTTQTTQGELEDAQTQQPRYNARNRAEGGNQYRGQHHEEDEGDGSDHNHEVYHSGR